MAKKSKQATEEGWGLPGCSRKWHYFKADGISLCRQIGFYMGPTEQGNDGSSDNCAECRKRKQAEGKRKQ